MDIQDGWQFELQMDLPEALAPRAKAVVAEEAPAAEEGRPPFGQWLLTQGDRDDEIVYLAAAAKRDPSFPANAGPDAIRSHLRARGAEAEAFEQVDLAEIAWGQE